MVNNQQNLNIVGIYEFFRASQSLRVNKDDISGEPLKIKYINVASFSTHQRYSTPTTYKDKKEDNNGNQVRLSSHKHQIHKEQKTFSSSLPLTGNGYVHKPPGRKPNILYVY